MMVTWVAGLLVSVVVRVRGAGGARGGARQAGARVSPRRDWARARRGTATTCRRGGRELTVRAHCSRTL